MKLRPTTTASHSIQFELEQLPFKTSELLAEVRAALFPTITAEVAVGYSRFDTVAYIRKESEKSWLININAVLNHRDTPIEVIRYILTHELLHIEVRPRLMTEAEWKEHRAPRRISKEKMEKLLQRECAHPPEFFERQRELMGSADLPHAWIAALMQTYSKLDLDNERITVKPGIYKALSDVKRLSLADIDTLTGPVIPLD